MICTRVVDSRTLVGCGNERRLAFGFFDQTTDDLGKGLLAHEPFHLGDGDKALLVDVMVPGGTGCLGYRSFIGILPIGAALDQLEAVPHLELAAIKKALAAVTADTPLDSWTAFAKATKLKAGVLKKIRPFITEKDPTAQPIDGEPDVDLRDTETIPFTYEGGIDGFMQNEVLTYAPDTWVDTKKTVTGYEISFSKYFYKPTPMRDIQSIVDSLSELEKSSDGMLAEIVGGLLDEYQSI